MVVTHEIEIFMIVNKVFLASSIYSYTNPMMTKELSRTLADYKERASSFDVLLGRALNKSKVGRVIYTNQCAQLANFYYREELPRLTREEKQEFERESEQTEKSN